MNRKLQVELVEDGFFWPAADLAVETRTEQGFLMIPLAGLTEAVQFFHVRAEQREFVLADATTREQWPSVNAASGARFAAASCAFMLEQREGYARLELAPCEDPLTLAAAFAAVAYSAAWDESDVFVVDIGDSRCAVHLDHEDGVLWATERPTQPRSP